MTRRIDHVAMAAPITVTGTAHAQVEIQVGCQRRVLDRDVARVRFYLDPEDGRLDSADACPLTPDA